MQFGTYGEIFTDIVERLPITSRNTDAERELIRLTVNATMASGLVEELKSQEQARMRVLALQEAVLAKQREVWVQAFSQHNQEIMLLQRIARALEKSAGILEPDLIPTEVK